MIPLDKDAAREKVGRSRWRVTIRAYATGCAHVQDRWELAGKDAMYGALADFEALHPECNQYGATHGLERCVRVHEET